MAVYSIKAAQKIPVTLNEAWDFFSNPSNLQAITPSHLGFRILSHHHGATMYPGQIIEYKIRPLLGIPVYWMTEITHVEQKSFFVDEQRYGPYSMWHHQHHFKPVEGGIEMTDIVHYKVPLGILGDIANRVVVQSQLRKIFAFRFSKTSELFGKWPGQETSIELY